MSSSSSEKVAPSVPSQGRTSSSKMPQVISTGWSSRFLPTAGPSMPERSMIAGVWIPPAASATARARTVTSWPSSGARPRRRAALPSSIRTRVDGGVHEDARAVVVGVLEPGLHRGLLGADLAAVVAEAADLLLCSPCSCAASPRSASRARRGPCASTWSRSEGMLLSELIAIRSQTASRLSSKSWPAQSESPKSRPSSPRARGRAGGSTRCSSRPCRRRGTSRRAGRCSGRRVATPPPFR